MLKFGNTFVNVGGTYLTDWTAYINPNPLNLPTNTIRAKFASGYTPETSSNWTLVDSNENIWDVYFSSQSWLRLFSYPNSYNLIYILGINATNVSRFAEAFLGCSYLTNIDYIYVSDNNITTTESMFSNCISLVSVPLFNTSNVSSMERMFYSCRNLSELPAFDTSKVTTMNNMCWKCTSLTNIPLFDTSNVTDMNSTFSNCTSLTNIPLFDTTKVQDMNYTFSTCTNVQSGALALYQQASTQTTPPVNHYQTFYNCGTNTQTGSAELAQIPSDWK